VARAYNWGNYVREYKRLPPDNTAAEKYVGRYRNGSDGRIIITHEGDKLLFKFIRNDKADELNRITDSTYVLGNTPAVIQFKQLPDGSLDLVISEDRRIAGSHLKVADNEMVPYEYLIKGEFDNALRGYEALLKADPNDNSIEEEQLNWQGYSQLEQGNKKLALDIFKINTILYPNSSNAYDSYGDAQKANDDKKGAIESYKKALKLNPKSEGTAKKLKELEGDPKK
jgi:tetratricopeptide (TPR) repeat protein